MDEFKERAKLIEGMLDKIKPIPKRAPREVKELTDAERQMLVLRAGWNNMPIEELRKKAGKEKVGRTSFITVAEPKTVSLEFENQVFGEAVELTPLATGADKASLARVILREADVIHFHKKNQETYVHERGAGEIFLNGKIYQFSTNTRVVMEPGTLHAVRPQKGTRVVFLCVSVPAFDPKDVFVDPRGRNW